MVYITVVVEDEFGNISHIRGKSFESPNITQYSDESDRITLDLYVDDYRVESNHEKQGEDDTDEVIPIYNKINKRCWL